MNPRNTYTPGQALPWHLQAIGRPVTMFIPGTSTIEAGVIARVEVQEVRATDDPTLLYDVRVASGGTYRNVALGDLNNPQPNTFTYAP